MIVKAENVTLVVDGKEIANANATAINYQPYEGLATFIPPEPIAMQCYATGFSFAGFGLSFGPVGARLSRRRKRILRRLLDAQAAWLFSRPSNV